MKNTRKNKKSRECWNEVEFLFLKIVVRKGLLGKV